MHNLEHLQKLAARVRYSILISTTAAGSGHPTSSLSAVDLMTCLLFGGIFKADLHSPSAQNNDRLIFSKGHAAPLLYALYAVAGVLSEDELKTLRKRGSKLEGHPTMRFPYTEAATGSLGQGLSIGVGMALNGKYLDKLPYKTYVLMGDSEIAEGSVWEAVQIASHYKLDNLIGIIDVNRLGQRGETMLGHNVEIYKERFAAFGWNAYTVDGHDVQAILAALQSAGGSKGKPSIIIAKTLKGKGVSFLEDKDGWHGKALNPEQLEHALMELGHIDTSLCGSIEKPVDTRAFTIPSAQTEPFDYPASTPTATRKAYGNALARLAHEFPQIVVLDAEVSNSTFAETFQKSCPERFFEMYIAEQNMVGTALGLCRRGKHPFVSTFAAFFTRAFDQIRMCQYSDPSITFVGSHAGVSIGEDGASQMALEDIAMFRVLHGSTVLYPSDAVSTEKLVFLAAQQKGISYIRTTRKETPILYGAHENFPIGGSKVLRKNENDSITVIAAGITLHSALAAYEIMKQEGIFIRVIDLYSIKPLDTKTLVCAVSETKALITVEDHYPEGGIGEAVMRALAQTSAQIHSLCVQKMPQSGTSQELLDFEEISHTAIVKKVKEILARNHRPAKMRG